MRSGLKWAVLAAVGITALLVVGWILWPQPSPSNQTRIEESNGVTVTASLLAGGDLHFKVVVDTHTVDLSEYDLVANCRLLIDGVMLPPEGESNMTDNTGHHLEASLRFEGKAHGRFVLVVEDLGGVPERRLEFNA